MFTDQITARAKVRIHQERAYDYNDRTGLWVYQTVGEDEVVYNLVTNTGRVQLHTFCYGTAPRTNGFNYVALSNNATPPAATDAILAGELSGNGLTRVQGIVTLPTGTGNATTILGNFIYTGVSPQGVQKAALFDLASGGVMNHEIAFATPRTLIPNDSLVVSFSVTLA